MGVQERLSLDDVSAETLIATEHLHRYRLAAKICGGLRVIDIKDPEAPEAPAEVYADAEGVTGARPNLVASLPPRDALGLRLGDTMPIALDLPQAHLFDAATGEPLR